MSVIEQPILDISSLYADDMHAITESLSMTVIKKGQSIGPYFWEGNIAPETPTVRRLYVESGRAALILTTFFEDPGRPAHTVAHTLDAIENPYFKIPSMSAWILRVSLNAWESARVSGLTEAIYRDAPARAIAPNQASIVVSNSIRLTLPDSFRAAIAG